MPRVITSVERMQRCEEFSQGENKQQVRLNFFESKCKKLVFLMETDNLCVPLFTRGSAVLGHSSEREQPGSEEVSCHVAPPAAGSVELPVILAGRHSNQTHHVCS